MSEEYPYARTFYVKSGETFTTSDMLNLVGQILGRAVHIRRHKETITLSRQGAYMTIQRESRPHVTKEANHWASRCKGLNSRGSTACFYLDGFDPSLILSVEPTILTKALWKTGKFAIMDYWSDDALIYDEVG